MVSGWRNGSLTAFWSDVFARLDGVVAPEIGGFTRLLVDEHVGKAAVQVLIWLDVQVSPLLRRSLYIKAGSLVHRRLLYIEDC